MPKKHDHVASGMCCKEHAQEVSDLLRHVFAKSFANKEPRGDAEMTLEMGELLHTVSAAGATIVVWMTQFLQGIGMEEDKIKATLTLLLSGGTRLGTGVADCVPLPFRSTAEGKSSEEKQGQTELPLDVSPLEHQWRILVDGKQVEIVLGVKDRVVLYARSHLHDYLQITPGEGNLTVEHAADRCHNCSGVGIDV